MKQAVRVFKALSDPTRLRILMLLLQRELCVCELVFALKMGQSRISHQLRILRDVDLVEDTREGKWTNYRISDNKRKNLRELFAKILKEDLSDLQEFQEDRKNLEIGIKENIRQKRCG